MTTENPIDIAGVRNFVALNFFTQLTFKKGDQKSNYIQWFIECLNFDEDPDKADPVELLRDVLHTADWRSARALYHLSMALSKWQPTERDLFFLCGANVEAA